MFDKLVESTTQKTKGRNKFYLMTSLIYGTSLSALAVATIIWFNPAMAETNASTVFLAPLPVAAPPPELAPAPKPVPQAGFVEPKEIPVKIADPKTVPSLPKITTGRVVAGVPNTGATNVSSIPSSFTGEGDSNNAPPPPPSPTPVPTPKATPTPAPTPEVLKMVTVSSVILQGKAIRKVQPPYPIIAKQVKAQGSVPVQITISEEGRVTEASVVGGHPLLRDAARQAALQWAFSPTILNGKGVKVSGVISFNFILN